MLSGEDAFDRHAGEISETSPPKGLAHERFLLGEQLPIAPVLLLGQCDQPFNPDEYIACLQPVHLHATRDHLILMAQSQIDLTAEESAHLLQIAQALIEDDFQHPLLFQGHLAWFIPAGPFSSLATHSIDQSHGRNIDWWMPRDTNQAGVAKGWRKLQNEIQMLWHIDPLNSARAQSGFPSINSIWLSGIGKLVDVVAPEIFKQSQIIYGEHPLLAGLAKYCNIAHQSAIDFSQLSNAFAWVDEPASLWPMLSEALTDSRLTELEIIDFKKGEVRRRILTNRDLYKTSWAFWKKSLPLSWKEIVQA